MSVYNSDSLLPSLIQSPSLSVAFFLSLSLPPSFLLLLPLCHSHSLPNSLEVYWHTGRIVLPSHYSSKFNEGAILKMCFQSVSLTPTTLLPFFHERVVFLYFCPSITLCLFSSLCHFLCTSLILNALALSFFFLCMSAFNPHPLPTFPLSSALSSSCQSVPSLSISPLTP